MKNKNKLPAWLYALSGTQFGALLVFMNFSGAMPLLQNEWGLSNTQAGAIQSASQVGYLISVIALSSLTDYIPPKTIVVIGTLWAGLWNLVFAAFADNTTNAVILRALIGFGIAGIYMPGVNLISQHIPTSQRGRAIGLFVASFTLGTALSIALGGNLSVAIGWRNGFRIMSIGPLLGALISWRYLPNAITKEKPKEKTKEKTRSVTELIQNRPALLVMLIYMGHVWEVFGLRNWLPTYLAATQIHLGQSLAQATRSGSAVAGFVTLIAAAATATVGAVSDKVSRTKTIIIVSLTGTFFIVGLGLTYNAPWRAIIVISLGAALLSNADSAVISTTLTEVVPIDYLGRTLSIYSSLGFLAGSISPLIFGNTLDFVIAIAGDTPDNQALPWRWAFAVLALGSLVGVLFAITLHKRLSPDR